MGVVLLGQVMGGLGARLPDAGGAASTLLYALHNYVNRFSCIAA